MIKTIGKRFGMVSGKGNGMHDMAAAPIGTTITGVRPMIAGLIGMVISAATAKSTPPTGSMGTGFVRNR
jgi:hypothetical protein